MRFTALVGATICLTAQVGSAIYADEAGVVDWHHVLLGHPRPDATFLHQPSFGSKASLLYTLSDKNVIAAVNPKDGEVVWRQHLTDKTFDHASFRGGFESENLVSGVGNEIASWGAADGRQIWSVDLGADQVRDLEILELETGKEGPTDKDSIALSQGTSANTVQRISAATGSKIWEFKDMSGDIGHQVSASTTQVFYVSLHSALLGGYKIRVTTLDPVTGKQVSQYTLGSESDVTDTSHVLAVGANSASPIIAWTNQDSSVLKINVIGSKSVASFDISTSVGDAITDINIHAPKRASARSHFLVSYESSKASWASVFHVDIKKSSVSKAYDLPKLVGSSAFSTSEDGSNVYFTRITNEHATVFSSLSHGILQRWNLPGFKTSRDLAAVQPVSAITELSVKGDSVSAARSAVLLTSGSWVSLRDATITWSRPEELAYTVAAAFAYPAEIDQNFQKKVTEETRLNVVDAYIHRWRRHINDLQALPALLQTLPDKLLSAFGLGSGHAADAHKVSNAFGYHKVIVAVTSTNRVIGMDAGEGGKVLWSFGIEDQATVERGMTPILKAHPNAVMEYKPSESSEIVLLFDAATGRKLSPNAYAAGATRILTVQQDKTGIVASLTADPNAYWRFVPPVGEKIVSVVARSADEPIASIGRVLGDRRVLYKYVNPNLLLVTTGPPSGISLTVQLVDSLTGASLFTSTHEDIVPTLPFAAIVSENWVAYTYSEYSGDSGSKSTTLVVADLYESAEPDERTSNATARMSDQQPYIPMQSYIVSEPISQLSVSQTTQGITSKDLLAVLPISNSVIGIPKAFIDPRRPIGRDANKDEQFEGLGRYTPTLEFDPTWYLNHQRELFGVKNVTTSPAILESTSLVFAYGLDAFGTRISPSFSFDVLDKSFNKLQMLMTVLVLGVGTVAVAPLVGRKGVDGRWRMPS